MKKASFTDQYARRICHGYVLSWPFHFFVYNIKVSVLLKEVYIAIFQRKRGKVSNKHFEAQLLERNQENKIS